MGLIYRDETKMASCSPDGLVGEDGLLGVEMSLQPPSTSYGWLKVDAQA